MSSSPNEPERYSIDEMMERLQKNKSQAEKSEQQEGELVTREDGSQAIRIRKRKRRSKQPPKTDPKAELRSKIIKLSGFLIVIFLCCLVAGVGLAYANSKPFRLGVIKKIAQASGAKVSADNFQFRMSPTLANAQALSLAWPEGNVLRGLNLQGIRAEIFPSSFLGKVLAGDEMKVSSGSLALDLFKSGAPKRFTPPAANGISGLQFKHYVIPQLDVLFGEASAPWLQIAKTEASFQIHSKEGGSQLLLNEGDIVLPNCPNSPKFKLHRGHMEFLDSEAKILSIRLRYPEDSRGELSLSGSVFPYETKKPSTLKVSLDAFDLSGLVGPELGDLFHGHVDSTTKEKEKNELTLAVGDELEASLSVSFESSPGTSFAINNFQFLKTLAKETDELWYLRPKFEGSNIVSGRLHWANGVIILDELRLENKTYMILKDGKLEMRPNGQIKGEFKLGLPEVRVKKRLNSLFGTADDGFRWTTLKISGIAAAPIDNLGESSKSKDTPQEGAPKEETPAPEDGKHVPSFEELTR